MAGFHAWLKLRRYVRKGEKGIVILAPMVGRKKTDDTLTEDAETRLFGFRAAHVFDVSQTDGDPLPEFATIKGKAPGWLQNAMDLAYLTGLRQSDVLGLRWDRVGEVLGVRQVKTGASSRARESSTVAPTSDCALKRPKA